VTSSATMPNHTQILGIFVEAVLSSSITLKRPSWTWRPPTRSHSHRPAPPFSAPRTRLWAPRLWALKPSTLSHIGLRISYTLYATDSCPSLSRWSVSSSSLGCADGGDIEPAVEGASRRDKRSDKGKGHSPLSHVPFTRRV